MFSEVLGFLSVVASVPGLFRVLGYRKVLSLGSLGMRAVVF